MNSSQFSTKEHLYLKDQLSMEQLYLKKLTLYQNQVQDQQLKSNIQNIMSSCEKRVQDLSRICPDCSNN